MSKQKNSIEIKVVKLNDIKPYFNNPRDNQRAISPTATSIDRYGFVKPILVDKNGIIIAGHTRYYAAFQLGMTEVPVVFSDMGEDMANQFRIADNKLAEKSIYDEEELIKELKEMDVPEDMQAFFFEDIRDMLNFNAEDMFAKFQTGNGPSAYESYCDSDGEIEDEEDEGNFEADGNEDEEGDAERGFYVPYWKEGRQYMKVICPYCNTIEEVCLDDNEA